MTTDTSDPTILFPGARQILLTQEFNRRADLSCWDDAARWTEYASDGGRHYA